MPKNQYSLTTPIAEDFEVGDDSDLPGHDQPVSADDIDAIAGSGEGSIGERRALLLRLKDDLQARQGMDATEEHADLIERIGAALATLREPADGVAAPDVFGADRPAQPDEILEREEEEEADPRDL